MLPIWTMLSDTSRRKIKKVIDQNLRKSEKFPNSPIIISRKEYNTVTQYIQLMV